MIANDASHELSAPFTLSRFKTGLVINENGVGASPGRH